MRRQPPESHFLFKKDGFSSVEEDNLSDHCSRMLRLRRWFDVSTRLSHHYIMKLVDRAQMSLKEQLEIFSVNDDPNQAIKLISLVVCGVDCGGRGIHDLRSRRPAYSWMPKFWILLYPADH